MPSNSSDALHEVNITKNNAIEDFANRSAQLKSQINEAVSNLRERILNCDPLHLLRFAQCYMLYNGIGISSEFQQLDSDSIAINRFIFSVVFIWAKLLCCKKSI